MLGTRPEVGPTTARSAPGVRGVEVPWGTVLPLAVLMAYADGFWLMALRGAVGSAQRFGSPFAHWLTESALMLPVFVLAVLAALMTAERRFGPVLHRRHFWTTWPFVALSGTVAGILALIGNSAVDYHLQVEHTVLMSTMDRSCLGDCLTGQIDATWQLQTRAVAYGSVLLLVTNLVVVGWLLALRGGRLDLSRRQTSAGKPRALRRLAPQGSGDLRLLLAGVALLGGALVHAAVVPAHLAEGPLVGGFFVLLAAAQLAVAGILLWRPDRLALLAAVVVTAGPVLLWAVSRTVGLPFGPEAGVAEPVGLADVAACLLEEVTLVIALAMLRGALPAPARHPTASGYPRALAVVALLAVTTAGLAGSGLAWLDVGVSGHHAESTSIH